jgi:hypothetical protein
MKKLIGLLSSISLLALATFAVQNHRPSSEGLFLKSCGQTLEDKEKGASIRQISRVFKADSCKKIFALVENKQTLDLASVVEVESLKYFTSLESLELDLFSEVDLAELKDLKHLKHLKITANFGRVSAKGLRTLIHNLPKLEVLSLGNLDIPADELRFADRSPVQQLELSEVGLETLEDLGYLPQVTQLAIPFSGIRSISGIETFTHLQKLVISGTRVEDLSPLSQLSQLSYLDISLSSVKELKPLAQLSKLKTIKFQQTTAGSEGESSAKLQCPEGEIGEALKAICSRTKS